LFNILLAKLIREKKQYESKFSMEAILLAMYMRKRNDYKLLYKNKNEK